MTDDSAAIVTAFIREFDQPAPDAETLAPYFTEDALYHNVPMTPIQGRDAIATMLGGMAGTMLSSGWEVKHQVAAGNLVMNERVDRFTRNGKPIAVRVMGVFELRDGKIAAWRDYFDLAEFQSQLA